jgi:AcrR family transcriptional regulator
VANRDPEATKARILAAAVREFSAKGISGARVDAIAARARVNKRMLYYYFESKQGLFREILRRRLVERSAAVRDTVADPDRLADRATQVASSPEHTRLLQWEALELDARHPVNEALRREFYDGLVEAVRSEQRAGRLPADLDASQLALSELCLTMGPFLLPQVTRLVTGMAVTDPDFVAQRVEFLRAWGRWMGSTRRDAPPARSTRSEASPR